MRTVSTKIPDDDAEKFRQIVLVKQLAGEDLSRSSIVRELVVDWIEEHEHLLDDVPDGADPGE